MRNPDRMNGGNGFWLQTATVRFYPDFVAELEDGRYLVVAYKGADRGDSGDTAEKEAIGGVWESRTGDERVRSPLLEVLERWFVLGRGGESGNKNLSSGELMR